MQRQQGKKKAYDSSMVYGQFWECKDLGSGRMTMGNE